MHIIKDMTQWQALRHQLKEDKALGFVPTMGNLHRGHASLVNKSVNENAMTVVSIFINPTQFNQRDDFTHYPRTLEADLDLLKQLDVDYCLLPNEAELYHDAFRFQIQETSQSLELEGQHRPGHFTGVLTVVMKLLQLVKPHNAYFGEKDYQQYELIRDMAKAFFLDVDIIAVPTIREDSGLAYSSRNNRLTPDEKKLAEQFAHVFHHGSSCKAIELALKALGIQVEYVKQQKQRRFAAVQIGSIRLIDNYSLDVTE